ncbi:hypothetical protein F2P56_022392 [Juglans regia]|uniref:Uncharacterized protein n=2 Tax=Juglans regia TaxID=51240 RepID=A0A2I4DMR8_JUGRE|nr:vascular-related unknown protein 1-like [Juglans regia]KAF5458360.1 hypothetical protein F2P56_022392 [Juglans regia]
MENSLSSCINKAIASKGAADCSPEESGWTKYLEDFSSYKGHDDSSSIFHSSSLISDAASSAAWKNSNNKNLKDPKSTLGFKNTRAKIIDDSLEDTASSPVSSPKVSDLGPVDMNPVEMKGGILEYYDPELQADERSTSEINFGGKIDINHDSRNLRKMGLCLVPLSKLVNYFR